MLLLIVLIGIVLIFIVIVIQDKVQNKKWKNIFENKLHSESTFITSYKLRKGKTGFALDYENEEMFAMRNLQDFVVVNASDIMKIETFIGKKEVQTNPDKVGQGALLALMSGNILAGVFYGLSKRKKKEMRIFPISIKVHFKNGEPLVLKMLDIDEEGTKYDKSVHDEIIKETSDVANILKQFSKTE